MVRGFRVGAARNVITPDLGCHIAGYFEDRIAQDVHDDLYARAIVLESGDTSVAIVVCDLIGLQLPDTDKAKQLAEELTGIPVDNIIVTATHTHFGPGTSHGTNVIRSIDYMDWLPGRIAGSIKMAQNRLRKARVGHASGHCPEEAHNRRYRMKDGTIVTNPGVLNPNAVESAGPIDPEVGLLIFMDDCMDPIAVLGNYALHYVGGQYGAVGSLSGGSSPVDLSITADYFGAFAEALPRMAGARFEAIMMNGCAGDVNNIDVFSPEPDYPHPWYQIERVADVVAAAAYRAWRGLPIRDYDPSPTLAAASDRFVFRRREFSEEQIKAAKEQLKDSAPENLGDRAWLQANTTVRLSERPLTRQSLIQALRVGEIGLVGLPGEIFVEIGMAIKQQSPLRQTLVGELANDTLGYIPTPKAFEQGSYEVYTTAASPETGPAMIESALGLLNKLAR
jgi:neutral ceramidase